MEKSDTTPDYFDFLFEEYRRAKGLPKTEIRGYHETALTDWYREEFRPNLENYAKFLAGQNIEGKIAEMGKDYYDSTVPLLEGQMDIIAITQYIEDFDKSTKVYYGGLGIHRGKTKIYCPEEKRFYKEAQMIGTLITHLPLTTSAQLIQMAAISPTKKIIVGTFGSVRDKNIARKRAELKFMRDLLESHNQRVDDIRYASNGQYAHMLRTR